MLRVSYERSNFTNAARQETPLSASAVKPDHHRTQVPEAPSLQGQQQSRAISRFRTAQGRLPSPAPDPCPRSCPMPMRILRTGWPRTTTPSPDGPSRFNRRCCERLKCQCQQCVACQNSHRFTEYSVTGRLSASQIVIVQRGEIIVDQRVRVDKFDRAAGLNRAFQFSRKHPRRLDTQHRTDPLASSRNAVSHRAVD